MRKHSKRKIRPVSELLAPNQHNALMMGPRMHLQLLSSGVGAWEHAASVASAFNIGMVTAHKNKRGDLMTAFQLAQDILCALTRFPEPLSIPEEDRDAIHAAFNLLDRYLGIQQRASLLWAVEYCERAIATGEGANILHLPKLQIPVAD